MTTFLFGCTFMKSESTETLLAKDVLKAFVTLSFSVICAFAAKAQSCQSPLPLCPGAPAEQTIQIQFPLTFDCFNGEFTHVMQFTTTDFVPGPGVNANVAVTGISCTDDTIPATMQMIVFETSPGANLCDPANYFNSQGCASGTTSMNLDMANLSPNTTYTVLLGTDATNLVGPCTFLTEITGNAVSLTVCCDETISLGDSHSMTATGNPNGTYSWFPTLNMEGANTDSPTVFPEELTTYVVSSDVGACTLTASVTVFVGPPVVIPNTITPNGDGVNDNWTISGIDRFPDAVVTVFDRWGQQLFKSIGYTKAWDGTNNGKRLPTATYYYVVELNSSDVKIPVLTGSISLIH